MPEGNWLGNMMGGLGGLGMLYGLSRMGNRPTPSVGETTQEAMAAMMRGYGGPDAKGLLPGNPLYNVETATGPPVAGYPGYRDMMSSMSELDIQDQQRLFDTYARPAALSRYNLAAGMIPAYGQIGRDEAYRDAMMGAGTQLGVLRGPGGQLIDEAYAKAQQVDQPFYQQRAAAGGMLGDLLGSFVDPRTKQRQLADPTSPSGWKQNPMYDPNRPGGYFTGALGGGEREEVQRGLTRQGVQTGSASGPRSMSDVVANAMTFGQGVQNRRDALGRALGQATSFLPASRSGFDPLQVALGRPSQQFGAANFSSPNLAGNTGQQQGFANNIFNLAGKAAGYQAKQPAFLSRLGQGVNVARGIGELGW